MGTAVAESRGWNQWVAKLMELARTGRELKFEIGDHLNRGEELYHDRIWQVLNDTGWSRAYIANVQYVARRIGPDERTKEIGWSLYQSMAPLDKQERNKLITRALSGEVIHRDEIRAMRNGNGVEPQRPQTEMEMLENNLAHAYVAVSRRLRQRDDQGTVNALDELVDAAMAIRGKISSKLERVA